VTDTCPFCGKPVDPDGATTHRAITGWEAPRHDGGANAIRLRETTGDFAHAACVRLASTDRKLGVTPGQQSLLEGSQT
jgi:hypothetical protein